MPAHLAFEPHIHTLALSTKSSVFNTWWAPAQDPTGTLTAKTTTGSPQPAGPAQPQGVRRHRRFQQGFTDAHL